MEVGTGELPQLLRYLKLATTPTPPPTPVKEEVKEEEPIDVTLAGPSVKKEEMTMFIEKPIHLSLGGQLSSTGVVTVTLPLKDPRLEWMPTQRRLCCAPSVHSLHIILIHLTGI